MESSNINVDAKQLRTVLRRMGKAAGRISGAGMWTLGATGLTIEWAGAADTLTGVGAGHARIAVAGDHMKGLARLPLADDEVTIRVDGDRLYIDTMSIPCAAVTEAARTLVPAFADDRQLLLAAHRHTGAELEAAGHAAELKRARGRLGSSVARAAKALAWLGIDEYDVDVWITERLRMAASGGRDEPPASATPRLVIVEGNNQIALFNERSETDP